MARVQTVTGGRAATTGVIPGRWALSVGDPGTQAPDGFRWQLLSNLARLESGHTPSRRVPSYWNGDIPWIGIRDATGNHGRVIYSTNESVTAEGIANSSARILPEGTVCLSRTASVGYVVSMGRAMATSQDFVNWVCGEKLRPMYLHYILLSEQESIRRFAVGSVHPTVYYPEVKAFHVCVPEIAEQDAILAVLCSLDDKIAINDGIATTTNELARALLEDVLLRDSETSDALLGDVVDVNRRKVTPVVGGTLRYIDISSVSVGRVEWPGLTSWDDAPGRARRGVSSGDTIWSTVRPNRKSFGLILDDDSALVVSTGFAVLTPIKVGPAFLYEVTKRDAFVQYLESVAEGSAYPAVRAERFEQAVIPLPSPERLAEFEAIAMPLRQRAHSAEVESRTLAALRDELLPKLLSGEIRARDAEKVVEDVM